MQIRGILFDWGGTLAHVDGQTQALLRAAGEVLTLLWGRAEPEQVQSLMTAAIQAEQAACEGPDFREVDLGELLRDWMYARGTAITAQQVEESLVVIGRNWVGAALSPIPGARQTLQALRAMGLPIGLVSNCFIPPEYCWDELRRQQFSDLLDCAVFSSGVGYRKPSRRIYAQAVRQLAGVGGPSEPGQILFVGDSPTYDVVAPAAMGMRTALVSSNAGLWAPEDYERARPDIRIDSVIELPALLADLS